MRYDTTRLVVEAGKPFEVILENGDFMPHNLVVTQPGSRKKVGEATMKMRPDQLDREGRAFVPPFEGPLTALGTATLGLELCEQARDLDAVIIPIGGGGLCAGASAAVKQLSPRTKV